MRGRERRIKSRDRLSSKYLVFLVLSLALLVAISFSAYAEEASAGNIESLKKSFIDLMNKWASFRWGLNCLVYVLYYDPSILKPWVDLNASLNKWDESEKRSFEDSVKSALQIGKATAFLITVENIGKKPFSISPVSKNLVLEDSKGRIYYPIKFEPQLESPISGKVQGLVFFPKLPKDAGRITLKIRGLPDGLVSFSWSLSSYKREKLAEKHKKVISWEELARSASLKSGKKNSALKKEKGRPEVKVVKPKAQIKTVIKPTPPQKPDFPKLLAKPKPLPPPPPKPKKVSNKGTEKIPVKLLPLEKRKDSDINLLKRKTEEVRVFDPKKVLMEYITAWKKGNYKKMYSLLSSKSREKISFSKFKKIVREGPPSWIKEGKYRFLPPKKTNRGVRITLVASVKLGFIKIIQTKSFYFTLEKKGWRIQF